MGERQNAREISWVPVEQEIRARPSRILKAMGNMPSYWVITAVPQDGLEPATESLGGLVF